MNEMMKNHNQSTIKKIRKFHLHSNLNCKIKKKKGLPSPE